MDEEGSVRERGREEENPQAKSQKKRTGVFPSMSVIKLWLITEDFIPIFI